MTTAIEQATGLMTAAVLYGSEDLRVEQMEVPRIAADEVLLKVKVALTCGTDLKVWKRGYHAKMITPPAVFGHELAGDIVAMGSEAGGGLRLGMRMVPANSAPCGECFYCKKRQENLCEDLLFNNGAYAEFVRIPGRIVRKNLLEIPAHVSYVDAAMIEPLACVLRGIHETEIHAGDTVGVIGCGPIGLQFVRMLAARGANVIALGKRKSQVLAAERLGARAAINVSGMVVEEIPSVVRRLTPQGHGLDAVIEAVGFPWTCAWALEMVRPGGTVNWFAGCERGTRLEIEPATLHYSNITIKSSFHHTPEFIREALAAVARGDVRASDFVTNEAPLHDLPHVFEKMKTHRDGMKTAILP
jgi:L-iditol 2-dehydrogenase